MESLAALSFACNILQLVEFSTKVIIGAEDLYKKGAKKEDQGLTGVTESLRRYTRDVTQTPSSIDAELRNIAAEAEDVGSALVELLNSLTVPEGAEHRKWKSACVMIKGMHKSDDVRRFDERLQMLQQLLNTRLLIIIRDSNTAISDKITELAKTNEAFGLHMRTSFESVLQKLDQMEKHSFSMDAKLPDNPSFQHAHSRVHSNDQQPISNAFDSLKRYFLGSNASEPACQESKIPHKDSGNKKTKSHSPNVEGAQMVKAMQLWPDLQELLSSLCSTASLVSKEQRILQSLYDPALMTRYLTVDEEYKNTFRWIFEDLEHGFPQWLESGNGVYWITGKAGSGKTTLMKFILDNSRTHEILKGRAGDSDLLLINHFFWAAGEELQRSYGGLIRSLLFQILRARPTLMPIACTRRIDGDEFTLQDPWALPELSHALRSLTQERKLDVQVCIFIDGLDEYEGNPADVIQILRGLSSAANFRLCVSSREWPIFQKEFGHSMTRLRMEDLTRSDIEKYVKGKLSEDMSFWNIATDDATNVTGTIINRAEGVFLWVRYVVNLLLRETANEPTIEELLEIVNSYPRGLDPLYERMFRMILDSRLQEAAETFQVVLKIPFLRAASLTFLEMERKNSNYALGPVTSLRSSLESAEILKVEARLRSSCMDFVELRSRPRNLFPAQTTLPVVLQYLVEPSHGSAREYLQRKMILLKQHARPDFDAIQSFWRSELASIKAIAHEQERKEFLDEIRVYTFELMIASEWYEKKYGKTLVPECEETFRVLKSLMNAKSNMTHQPFEVEGKKCLVTTKLPTNDEALLVLGLIASYGLHHFFQHEISLYLQFGLNKQRSQLLLDLILSLPTLHKGFGLLSAVSRMGFNVNPKTIRVLLKARADPNKPVTQGNGESSWYIFLSCLFRQFKHSSDLDRLRLIIVLLLKHGGNPNVKCAMKYGPDSWWVDTGDWQEKTMELDQILQAHFEADDPIFNVLKESRSSWRHKWKPLLRIR